LINKLQLGEKFIKVLSFCFLNCLKNQLNSEVENKTEHSSSIIDNSHNNKCRKT